MTDLTEKNYVGDIVRDELDNYASRRTGTIKSGAGVLKKGTLLGKFNLGTASETHAGNTGNGAMTLDATTPVLVNAQVGVYTVKCTAAATNSGTFRVFDPLGDVLGDVVVGATFADQIKFVIADGSADFIVGDTFLVTVAAGSGKYIPAVYGALDGTGVGAAILLDDIDATSGDVVANILTTTAQVDVNKILYDASATTDNEKAALRAGLEANNVQFLGSA
jgi:hypothetical protein